MNKYLISADIEGITGVIGKEFMKENGRYYQIACKYMLSDVNAVIQGILNADSEAEILVRDAHGMAAVNLNLEHLHPKASLIQGWGSIQNMVTGLDKDFKGVFFVGFHAGGENIDGVLAHTVSSMVHSIKVNGKLLNEAGIFALYAGLHDVPVAFISGDDHAIKEAKEQLGDIVGVVVKESLNRGSAKSLSLTQAAALLEKNAALAVDELKQNKFKPFKMSSPVTMEIKFYDSGVRISPFRNLSEILKFDDAYKFDLEERLMTIASDDVLEVLQRLNMIMHITYGIKSSGG